jgi:nucleoside-triphosphatase THEP1
VKDEPRLVIVTGPPGCGKTRLCQALARALGERHVDVAGLISPERRERGLLTGVDVVDLRSGERRGLADLAGPHDGPTIGHWHFLRGGLDWGNEVLSRAVPCDLLIVDEIGPLELSFGDGWTLARPALTSGRYRLSVVVVRPSLVGAFRESYPELAPEILSLTERGATPSQDEILRVFAANP